VRGRNREIARAFVRGLTGGSRPDRPSEARRDLAKFVTSSAEEYRRYARQCLEVAPTFQGKKARATLLGLAQAWSRLAHLALANRQIAELTVQIARQRVIVKHALDTGQRSEMAESLLDALEGSLRIFEKHRIFLLSCSVNHPSKRIIQRPDPLSHNGSGLELPQRGDAVGVLDQIIWKR
jgi:hypothetical protein